MMKKTSLGTGLSSLIPNKTSSASSGAKEHRIIAKNEGDIIKIPIDRISPNPNQPRYYFDENNLKDLSESIKKHGIIQPIIVTKLDENKYELIAGERRMQASKLIGLKYIPAIVRPATHQEKLELALVENIQRHNLNVIEEAKAYKKLKTEFNLNQDEIAERTGKSRPAVANTMRLLELPVEIQRGIIEEKITPGHAKAILGINNPEKQRALYEFIIKNELSVRATENKVNEITVHTYKRKSSKAKDPKIQEIEDKLQQKFGTKVQVSKKNSTGRIAIDFFSEEEFNKILNILAV